MNVIVANKYQAMLANLDIDIIKTMYGEFDVDEIISTFSNFFYNRMILDITAIKNYKDINTIQRLSAGLDMSKVILVLDDSEESSSAAYLSKLISMGIYNFSRNVETIKYLIQNPNSYKDVAQIHQLNDLTTTVVEKVEGSPDTKIIGIVNVTDHAGATTLIYMLKKQLQRNYKVLGIEIDRKDFSLFNDKDLISTTKENFAKELLKAKEYDVVLVDLNNTDNEDACGDILYLIEPTTIKLNKMIRRNRGIFEKLKGRKIVLNKSLLDSKDVLDFEYEAKTQVYYNIPPLDDKKDRHNILDVFLTKLGFIKQNPQEKEEKGNKILGLFKF
ncbi:MAG TPA: hypothetical protein PLX66_00385 [Bacilli bacterium]|nr:hypothetical protein [Bacilli bacterium]